MSKSRENTIIALTFSLFQVVILSLLNAFDFFEESNIIVLASVTFILGSTLEFLILTYSSKLSSDKKIVSTKVFSFFISSLISGLGLVLVFPIESDKTPAFLAAFLVIPILPATLFLLRSFVTPLEKILTMKIEYIQSEQDVEKKEKELKLENDNGKLILKTNVSKIICFESDDNYVITHYLDKNGQLKKSMDRLSLKHIEDILKTEQIAFERVHKSYIINPEFVSEVKGKAQAYRLFINELKREIPVSRSYDISVFKG